MVTKKCFVKTVTHGSHVPLRIHSKDPLRRCCKAKTTSSPSSPSLIPYPPSRLSSSRAAAASTTFTHRPGHGGLECMLNKEFIVIFCACKSIQQNIHVHMEVTWKEFS